MKVELSEQDIRNTLVWLREVELRGSSPDVLIEMGRLQRLYIAAQERIRADDAAPEKDD